MECSYINTYLEVLRSSECCFTVFEEIAEGFSGIDDEAFQAVQSKKRLADEIISASFID